MTTLNPPDPAEIARHLREHAACLAYAADTAAERGDDAWQLHCTWTREHVLDQARAVEHARPAPLPVALLRDLLRSLARL